MISFITHLRPPVTPFHLIQNTATHSWHGQHEDVEIFITGDPGGRGELATVPATYLHTLKSARGYGLVNDMLHQLESHAKNDWCCMVSADIVFDHRVADLLELVDRNDFSRPFLVGRRHDVDLNTVKRTLHGPSALDYFFWRRGTLGKVPSFRIGHRSYDNWMLYAARYLWSMDTIDVTDGLLALHLNHPHIEHGGVAQLLVSDEYGENFELATNASKGVWNIGVDNTEYVLRRGVILPRG